MGQIIKDSFPYALLMGLLLLAAFIGQGYSMAFYLLGGAYAGGILLATAVAMLVYSPSLEPNVVRGEGSFNWYLGRIWTMAFGGILLGMLLVGTYAYQFDSGYFNRRMEWERTHLELTTSMPEEVIAIFMEDEANVEPFHLEELTVGGVALLATAICSVLAAAVFRKKEPRKVRKEAVVMAAGS